MNKQFYRYIVEAKKNIEYCRLEIPAVVLKEVSTKTYELRNKAALILARISSTKSFFVKTGRASQVNALIAEYGYLLRLIDAHIDAYLKTTSQKHTIVPTAINPTKNGGLCEICVFKVRNTSNPALAVFRP